MGKFLGLNKELRKCSNGKPSDKNVSENFASYDSSSLLSQTFHFVQFCFILLCDVLRSN